VAKAGDRLVNTTLSLIRRTWLSRRIEAGKFWNAYAYSLQFTMRSKSDYQHL